MLHAGQVQRKFALIGTLGGLHLDTSSAWMANAESNSEFVVQTSVCSRIATIVQDTSRD